MEKLNDDDCIGMTVGECLTPKAQVIFGLRADKKMSIPFGMMRSFAPNDPKLSDGGAWRGSCEGGAKKEATGVGQRWLGRETPGQEIAATVTRGAVRCSAWLGH